MISDWWKWLGDNAAQVTAAATVLLACVTAFYVRSTWQAAKSADATAKATVKAAEAAERQVRLQTAPYVVPTFLRLFLNDGGHFEIEVRLRNDVAGAALNVSAAVALFMGSFDDRIQAPFRHLVGSISPGGSFPPEGSQEKSWVIPTGTREEDSWRAAIGNESYGLVVICADAAGGWWQFVYWKRRNRTEVEAIDRPVEAGYED